MNTAKKVILLFNDSLVPLERMIPMLEDSANVEFVVHAGTYKEALGLLEDLRPDLILLDINLPDKNGMDLLKLVREKYSHIIVMMMTNHATMQYRETCANLRSSYFFDKSNDLHMLSGAQINDAIPCH